MIPGFPTFLGVNLPWQVYGCDFGGNAWFPDGGLGRPGAADALNGLFERLSSAGLRVVRWFLFCDGRAGLRFDPAGTPLGLDAFCFRDIDAALDLARRHGVTLLFVVFDFTWFRRRRAVNGVGLFGRRRVVAEPAHRRALLDRVVAPLFARYGREPLVQAWDLLNEPEWATLGYGGWPWRGVTAATMRAWLGEMAAMAHEGAVQPATVGLASLRGLPLVAGCALDFYQVHWYDRLERRSPLTRPPLQELDRPLLLGEFPTSNSALSAADLVATAREAGYSGALAWSAAATDAFSDLAALEEALGRPGARG
ncbi:MAG: Endo-beta-mannanase [Acidobacteria bacterium]|nr:Endo-beta-mannanase [Acidobacteriota bacterium]